MGLQAHQREVFGRDVAAQFDRALRQQQGLQARVLGGQRAGVFGAQQLDAAAAGQQLHGLRIVTGGLEDQVDLAVGQRVGGGHAGGVVELHVGGPHAGVLQHQPGRDEGR
jgi:hypothetical protein